MAAVAANGKSNAIVLPSINGAKPATGGVPGNPPKKINLYKKPPISPIGSNISPVTRDWKDEKALQKASTDVEFEKEPRAAGPSSVTTSSTLAQTKPPDPLRHTPTKPAGPPAASRPSNLHTNADVEKSTKDAPSEVTTAAKDKPTPKGAAVTGSKTPPLPSTKEKKAVQEKKESETSTDPLTVSTDEEKKKSASEEESEGDKAEDPKEEGEEEEASKDTTSNSSAPSPDAITTETAVPAAMKAEMAASRRKSTEPMNTISKYQHTPVPLYNFGATCYMNASLQCLLHTPTFLHALSNAFEQRKAESKGTAACPAVEALLELGEPEQTDANALLKKIKKCAAAYNSQFESNSQNDAHEFVRTFLTVIHDEINRGVGSKAPYKELEDVEGESEEATFARWMKHIRRVDDSLVYDYFGGVSQSKCVCYQCGHTSFSFEPFLDLSIQLESGPSPVSEHFLRRASMGNCETVDQILRECYVDENVEQLNGNNQLMCVKCKKKRDGIRAQQVKVWPKILALNLKRFTATGRKLSAKLVFPHTLSIKNLRYRLYAVCCHSGSESFGHYTSYVCVHGTPDETVMQKHFTVTEEKDIKTDLKSPMMRDLKNMWFNCNDSYISNVDAKEVSSVVEKAYILFYFLM